MSGLWHTKCFRVSWGQNVSGTWTFIDMRYLIQFGTQAKSHRSLDHNSQAAVSAFSAPWYFSEMELEPVAG